MNSRIFLVWVMVLFPRSSDRNLRSMQWSLVRFSNGNRIEWSPIRSVIIRVITKSDDHAAESDLFITSMITDRIGRHEVLLPIHHKNYNFLEKKNSKL